LLVEKYVLALCD